MGNIGEHFENSPQDKEIMAEIGHKELSEYTDEELAEEHERLQTDAHVLETDTMTPTERIRDNAKQLSRLSDEIERRKANNPS